MAKGELVHYEQLLKSGLLRMHQNASTSVKGYPINYGDFLCFDKIRSKSSAQNCRMREWVNLIKPFLT